jgi:glyoxylase-like metal-dependent hydrolase (beta-lactamase superfamily II)
MLRTTPFDEVTRIDSARTIASRGYYWTTAYLVDGILVDTGCAHTAHELVEIVRDKHISHIVNTHSHEDHIGANGLLQQRGGLNILAHPLALPVLENPQKNQPLQLYRRVMWGWPQPCTAQPALDGDVIQTEHFRFRVIYTPGHSPDHICLYEPDRGWLFSGDLFVGGKERALRVDYNIWQIIAALKQVAELPLTRLFPGCARVRENPSEELIAKVQYLEEVGGRVRSLYQKGYPPDRIARHLFGGPMWIELVTAGQFSRRGLVNSFLQDQP